MIHFIESGDIFNIDGVSSYAHGCNCAGAMGKGIALQFKQRYPKMYSEYKKLCSSGAFILGDVFVYKTSNDYVFNLATQATWKSRAELDAIETSVRKMLHIADQKDVSSIALPRIGAGLGRLDWAEVRVILSSVSQEYSHIELYVVENYHANT